MDDPVKQGHYAKKQMGCPSRLIAWSHRRRFVTGLNLARGLAGKTVLDYGSGDGTFLAMLMESHRAPALAVGAEIDDRLVEDCRRRLGQREALQFVPARELDGSSHAQRYDAVICMEVLEHVVKLDAMLEQFDRWLAPAGQLLVSVPVETGLPLLVKQAARRIAGWRGLGDYPGTTGYTWPELCRGVFAGAAQHIPRPVHRDADGFESHDHKGFNWMALRAKLRERFDVLRITASPIGWLTPHLASQVWFVARKGNPTADGTLSAGGTGCKGGGE